MAQNDIFGNIQREPELRKKKRKESGGVEIITPDHPRAGRIPFLNAFGAWRMEKRKYILGEEGYEEIQNLIRGANPTIRIPGGGGVTDLYAFSTKGQLSWDDFRERTGLDIPNPFDPQWPKRFRRIMREFPAYAFSPDIPIASFPEEFKNQWDGMNIISRTLVERVAREVPPKLFGRFMHTERFALTFMMPEGQLKGHAMVWPQEEIDKITGVEGALLAFPEGSAKKQLVYNSRNNNLFIGLEPVKGHNYLNADVQTVMNYYRYLLSNEEMAGSVAERMQTMIENLKGGQLLERDIDLLFSGVYSDEQLLKRLEMPIFEFVASGGDLRWSPYMINQYGNQIRDVAGGQLDKMRIPIQGGSSLYMVTASAHPDPKVRDLPPGTIYLDYERASAFINNYDLIDTMSTLGGGDEDDRLNIYATTEGRKLLPARGKVSGGSGEVTALVTRSPQAQGEHKIFKVFNPEALYEHGIQPANVSLDPIRKNITQISDKRYKVEKLPEVKLPESVKDIHSFANFLTEKLQSQAAVLGMVINAMGIQQHLYGRAPELQYAPTEEIIDALEKNLTKDVSGLIEYYENEIQNLVKKYPLPADAIRRAQGWLKGTSIQAIPTTGHWMDDLQERLKLIFQSTAKLTWELANQASLPIEFLRQIKPGQQGLELWKTYTKALYARGYDVTDEDYRRATEAGRDYLLSLDIDDARQAVLQNLFHPVTKIKKDGTGGNLNDKFLWTDEIKGFTFEALRHIGALSHADPDFENTPPWSTETKTLMTRGAWALHAMKRGYKDPQNMTDKEVASFMAAIARGTYVLEGRSFTVKTESVGGVERKLVVDEAGNALGYISRQHFGAYENLIGGEIAKATARSGARLTGDLTFSIVNPQYRQTEERITDDQDRIEAVRANYFEFARKVLAGEDTATDLPPVERGVVGMAMGILQKLKPVNPRDTLAVNRLVDFATAVADKTESLAGLSPQVAEAVQHIVSSIEAQRREQMGQRAVPVEQETPKAPAPPAPPQEPPKPPAPPAPEPEEPDKRPSVPSVQSQGASLDREALRLTEPANIKSKRTGKRIRSIRGGIGITTTPGNWNWAFERGVRQSAEIMRQEVLSGEPGRRLFDESGFIGATSSTYPDWYGPLRRSKKDVLDALERISIGSEKNTKLDQALRGIAESYALDPETGDPLAMLSVGMEAEARKRLDDLIQEGVDVFSGLSEEDAQRIYDLLSIPIAENEPGDQELEQIITEELANVGITRDPKTGEFNYARQQVALEKLALPKEPLPVSVPLLPANVPERPGQISRRVQAEQILSNRQLPSGDVIQLGPPVSDVGNAKESDGREKESRYRPIPRGFSASVHHGPNPFQFEHIYDPTDTELLWEEAQRGNEDAIAYLSRDMLTSNPASVPLLPASIPERPEQAVSRRIQAERISSNRQLPSGNVIQLGPPSSQQSPQGQQSSPGPKKPSTEGQQPPDDYEDLIRQLNEPPQAFDAPGSEASGSRIFTPYPARPEVLSRLIPIARRSQSAILGAPTGYGKTQAGAQWAGEIAARNPHGQGLIVITSPLRRLNQQLAKEFQSFIGEELIDPATGEPIAKPQSAFDLPGKPGHGATTQEIAEWERVHNELYRTVGITFTERGLEPMGREEEDPAGNKYFQTGYWDRDPKTGKYGFHRGRIRIYGKGTQDEEWEWVGDPVAVSMSYEKLAASPVSRLGRFLNEMYSRGLVSANIIDEAHNLFSDNRFLGRYILDTLEGYKSQAPTLAMSGSFTEEQLNMISSVFGIPEENIVNIRAEPHPRVKWFARAVDRKTKPETIADWGDTDQPMMIFPQNLKGLEPVAEAMAKRGYNPFIVHGDKSNPMTSEQQAISEEKIQKGPMLPKDVAVATGVIGEGINRPEVGEVRLRNPFDISALEQKVGRLRNPKDDDPDRNVKLELDPSLYTWRAKQIEQSAQALSDVGFLGGLYREVAVHFDEYSKNWQTASTQMQEVLQDKLAQYKLNRFSANTVLGYFFETGLIKENYVKDPETGEGYMTYILNPDIGDSASKAADYLARSRVRSRYGYDSKTNTYKEVPISDRVVEDANLAAREQRALAGLFGQALTYGSTEEEAGEIIRQGITAYKETGVSGLEDFANRVIPERFSERFTAAFDKATENLEQMAKATGDVAKVMGNFVETVDKARENIAGSDTATRAAVDRLNERAREFDARGQEGKANFYREYAQKLHQSVDMGMPGGAPPFQTRFGGQSPEGMANQGIMAFAGGIYRSPIARGIYGLYMANRLWRMVAGEVFQTAAYAGMQDFAPPALYARGDYRYGELESGFETRQDIGQAYMGRGALRQFGAFMDLDYAMSGFGPVPAEVAASTRTGLGLALSAVEFGTNLAQGGFFMKDFNKDLAEMLMGAGGRIATVGGILGIGVTATGIVHGAANAILGLEGRKSSSWSNILRNLVMGPATSYAMLKEGATPSLWGSIGIGLADNPWVSVLAPGFAYEQRMRMLESAGLTEEDVRKHIPSTLADFIFYEGETGAVAGVRELAERLATGRLGGKPEEYVGLLTDLGRRIGGVQGSEDQVQRFLEQSLALGYTPQEWGGMYAQTMEQMGYIPGSSEALALMQRMTGISTPVQLHELSSQASRVAQFAGYLAPYVGYSQAAQLVQRGSIDTPYEARTLQGAMDLFSSYGVNLKQVVGQKRKYKVDFIPNQPPPEFTGAVTTYGDLQRKRAVEEFRGGGTYRLGYDMVDVTVDEALTDLKQRIGSRALDLFSNYFGGPMLSRGASVEDVLRLGEEFGQRFNQLNPYQQELGARILGGDMKAASYASWYQPKVLETFGMSVAGNRWFDRAGRPIFQTSGRDFMNLGYANRQLAATAGISFFANVASGMVFGGMTEAEAIASEWGVSDVGMVNAFLNDGGVMGAQRYARERLFQNQMASIGIGFAQIAAQEQYLWGGGPWMGTPAPGSMWYLEDQMKRLQYQSQMADFRFAQQKMEVQNQFAIRQEELSWDRMTASHSMQRWQQGFDLTGMMLQRAWARQDWAYQDTMRGLQFEWGMEDINEAIRYSTGRERRKLIRQRDRLATTYSLEGEQIETQRERQEQTWAREDERFRKQQQYSEELMALDRKQFDLNREQRQVLYDMDSKNLKRQIDEYQKQFKLQEEMTELSRDYQAKQLEFQKASLGLQAESLQIQKDLETVTRETNNTWDSLYGTLNNINEMDNIQPTLRMLELVLNTASEMDTDTLGAFYNVVRAIRDLDPGHLKRVFDDLTID